MKDFTPLSGSRAQALGQLAVTPDEQIAFATYLNYAVNNICEIAGIHVTDENKVQGELLSSKNGRNFETGLQHLADFFWLFREKEPQQVARGYKRSLPGSGWENETLWLAREIFALRNFFVHLDRPDCAPLLVERKHYVFLEGLLAPAAKESAMVPGANPAKVFKQKLLNPNEKTRTDALGEKILPGKYEFTRKGLVFLVCLALYKDEAEEFCHLFPEMKVPDPPADGSFPRRRVSSLEKLKGEKGPGRALIEFFTYYSFRRGRKALDGENNLRFLCFADLVGYLNKVPGPAFEYLSLDGERDRLSALAAASSESEENKRFKYSLHRRDKDRFLSFAAAFCEDFDRLPTLRFKRLDVAPSIGRHRYLFGKEADNRNALDRHYAVRHDAIRFEFRPESHLVEGGIAINALRGAVSATELRNLIWCDQKGFGADEALRSYFTAYHRLLERLANAESTDDISFGDVGLLEDVAALCGTSPEVVAEKLEDPDFFRPWLPDGIVRCLFGESGEKDPVALRDALCRRLRARADHADDFLVRLGKARVRRGRPLSNEEDPPVRRFPPRGRPEKSGDEEKDAAAKVDLWHPPVSCRFSDAAYVARVFDYLNLFLAPDRKFRQLPVGEAHREGNADFLYQLVHAKIGKFSLDPAGVWGVVKKPANTKTGEKEVTAGGIQQDRPELAGPVSELKKKVKEVHARLGGKQPTLEMLAMSAAELFRDRCDEAHERWENISEKELDVSALRAECRLHGVRPGLPCDRKSILKTVLGIDPDGWARAWDYGRDRKRTEPRALESEGHVVSQIPLPNGFARRIMEAQRTNKAFSSLFSVPVSGGPAAFDFPRAIRERPVGERAVALRGFYDAKPIVAYMKSHDPKDAEFHPGTEGINPEPAVGLPFDRRALDSAWRAVRDVETQDRLLLALALKYWEAFRTTTLFDKDRLPFGSKTTIAEFFETEMEIPKDGTVVRVLPQDVNRPSLATVLDADNFKKLRALVDRDRKAKSFRYYDLLTAWRRQKALDRRVRLRVMPYLINLDRPVRLPSGLAYSDGDETANRALEFPFYKTAWPGLSKEAFDAIVDLRNAVQHNGFLLDDSGVLPVFARLGVSGVLPGTSDPGQNDRRSRSARSAGGLRGRSEW